MIDHHLMTIRRMKNYVDRLRSESEDIGYIVDLDTDMESLESIEKMLAARESEGGGFGDSIRKHRGYAPQPDKWIPCSERLPTEAESGDDGCGDAWVTDGKKVWSAPAFRLESDDPFLWMPIDKTKPAPPEQESE